MANSVSEEVSLLDLLASFLATLKRNILIAILLPVAGLLTGLVISLNSKDLFESALLVETSLLSENECKFLFDQLNKVGTIPGLSTGEQNALGGYSFRVYRNGSENELNEKSLFIEATARVTDRSIFPSLQKALLSVIDKYPSVTRHRAEREKFYSEMIARIDAEIESMEVIKRQISGNVQATYLNPAELYANSVLLQKEKIQYEIRREEAKAVHLIKGFDSMSVNTRPGHLFAMVTGFAVGLALLCVVLFVKFFMRYVNAYETTH